MNVEPPREGKVYVTSGTLVASPRGHGILEQWRKVVRRRRGRPRDERVAGWAARIERPEFQHLDSLHEKSRKLAWDEHIENGGDPDISRREFDKLVEARRQALMRWYKKRR